MQWMHGVTSDLDCLSARGCAGGHGGVAGLWIAPGRQASRRDADGAVGASHTHVGGGGRRPACARAGGARLAHSDRSIRLGSGANHAVSERAAYDWGEPTGWAGRPVDLHEVFRCDPGPGMHGRERRSGGVGGGQPIDELAVPIRHCTAPTFTLLPAGRPAG